MGTFKVWQNRRQSNRLMIWFYYLTYRCIDISATFGRNDVCRAAPINCDLSGPAERVRLMIGRFIGNYPAREFHHYWRVSQNFIVSYFQNIKLDLFHQSCAPKWQVRTNCHVLCYLQISNKISLSLTSPQVLFSNIFWPFFKALTWYSERKSLCWIS